MLPIQSCIDTFFSRQQQWQIRLAREWKSVVGDLHQRMCLEKIFQNTLVVGVYDAHWMQELYLLAPLLIQTINKRLGQEYVQHIRFKLVVPRDNHGAQKLAKPSAIRQARSQLLPKHQEALEKIVDVELRQYLYNYFQQCGYVKYL